MKAYNPLKYYMTIRKVKNPQVAQALKCTTPTFSRKLNGLYNFTAAEIKIIADFLVLSNEEILEIWFKK